MTIAKHRSIFYALLTNALVVVVTNSFVWFAVTFWVYLETRSVIATSLIAGMYTVANAVSALFFGALVDHNKKKTAMVFSTVISFIAYAAGLIILLAAGSDRFTDITSPVLWVWVGLLLFGSIIGNIRTIALSTTVPVLFEEKDRGQANGLIGTTNGIAFAITSVASGIVIGFFGMDIALMVAVLCMALAIVHLSFIKIPEPEIVVDHAKPRRVDLWGTFKVVRAIPGLLALIFFTTFNNFLGGVFMALMDAYGLSLVSVQAWGLMWGVLSTAFIAGGLLIAKFGLGKNPLRTMIMINMITWSVCIFFTIQESIVLTAIGLFTWMICVPFIEASEQTILQGVVPQERLGRVIGFAQSVESTASPVTTLFIGPLTQWFFIPFMTTGAGVTLIGGWFGVGDARGIALVFTVAGILGLTVTLAARFSASYRRLSHTIATTMK
ncbi:MFS transporter [Patescibacteria group bacterium]|nr:MFS transporter [Patescibacteria group bacterium]